MGNQTSTIYEGSLECHAPDRMAFLADWISCALFQLPYKLEYYKFGYITATLVILVIVISIFGKIQHHYRWFILNQAIFDLFVTYDYLCTKFAYSKEQNCYFGFDKYLSVEDFEANSTSEAQIMKNLPIFGIFILTGSRFLTLFFPNFFKKWNKTWKILLSKLC